MTPEEHKRRHEQLHKHLDELFADYITHGNGHSYHTILQLLEWASKQKDQPDHEAS